jgi:hypothetical protein
MVLLRLALAVVAALVIAGCGAAPEVAVVPTVVATPTPSCQEQAAPFLSKAESLARVWDDANTLAGQTPRASLSTQIDKLQSIRRDAEDLEAPECAVAIKQHLVNTMDTTIRGFIAFLGQKSDIEVKPLFTIAGQEQTAFQQAVQQLKAGTPIPTAEPILKDGLGITQAAIQDVYKADYAFEDSPLYDGTPRMFGTSADKFNVIELIGAPQNVRSASLTRSMRGGNADKLGDIKQSMRSFLKLVAPDWGIGDAWLTAAMGRNGEQTTVARGRVVSYQQNAGSGDEFILTVSVP